MAGEEPRFVRWQKITIEQLGYALNLILALTIATVGYWFVLLTDLYFDPNTTASYFMIISLATLAPSALCGLICVLNRLYDFRGTARRAKDQPDCPTQDELRGVGDRTWWLFYFQIGLFAIGVLALGMALLLTYGWKIA